MAAGGGGDAVGALLARRALGDTDERPPLVTTCAWERLRIDPVPGPRARADFADLGLVGGEPCEVLSTSYSVPTGRSALPRLAETSGARIFLHDFDGGAVGLAEQLRRLAASLRVDHLVVLDVGGDVVARGQEPTLKSPLADSLTLAAALVTGIRTTLVVLGPGSDGELPEAEVLSLLSQVGARAVGLVGLKDVQGLQSVLTWHPTEASAIVAAGAKGVRGSVAMRRGQVPVPLTECAPEAWAVSSPTFDLFPLAKLLRTSTTLSEAEDVLRTFAVDEIDFERRVAGQASSCRRPKHLADVILELEAAEATHITGRRLAEILYCHELDVLKAREGRPRSGIWSVRDLRQLASLND